MKFGRMKLHPIRVLRSRSLEPRRYAGMGGAAWGSVAMMVAMGTSGGEEEWGRWPARPESGRAGHRGGSVESDLVGDAVLRLLDGVGRRASSPT